MIEVADLQTAIKTPGAVMIEACIPPKVYFAGDPLPSHAILDNAAENARLAAIDASIAGDSTIAQLKAMTIAEFDTWWAANVTTLAQANNILKRLVRLALRRLA